MPKVSHYKTIYFLRYTHPRYIKCCFTNIQKQQKMFKKNLCFKKMQTFQVNNSIILRIENTKSWRCCFHINPNIWWNFQICISVTLRTFLFHRNIMLHSLDTQFFLFLIAAWTSEYVRSWQVLTHERRSIFEIEYIFWTKTSYVN